MPRIGIHCPVDGADLSDEECLACREDDCRRTFRDCTLTWEMLKGMMDGSGRATAHISATMLTGNCARRNWLEMREDYRINPIRLFPAWRGTMGHQMTESYPQPWCVYERRFETRITLPSGATYLITGAIDKLDIDRKHIEDFKTKADSKLNRLRVPQDEHVWQLNIYRWLVMVGWPQRAFTHRGTTYKPGVAAEIEVDTLKLVYWSMEKPKPLVPELKDLEEVEAYVVARVGALTGEIPGIPRDLDPWTSTICCDWCAVRNNCIAHEVGF